MPANNPLCWLVQSPIEGDGSISPKLESIGRQIAKDRQAKELEKQAIGSTIKAAGISIIAHGRRINIAPDLDVCAQALGVEILWKGNDKADEMLHLSNVALDEEVIISRFSSAGEGIPVDLEHDMAVSRISVGKH